MRDQTPVNFTEGRLVNVVVRDMVEVEDDGRNPTSAAFPPLVFLQLLFGYRSLAELRYAFPDCVASHEGTLLLNALFPKQPSLIVY